MSILIYQSRFLTYNPLTTFRPLQPAAPHLPYSSRHALSTWIRILPVIFTSPVSFYHTSLPISLSFTHFNLSDLCSHIFSLTLLLQLSLQSRAYSFWHRRSSCCCTSLWSGSCGTAGICIYGVRTIDLGNISSAFLEECVSRQFLSPCKGKIHYIYCFPLIHYANYIGRQGH